MICDVFVGVFLSPVVHLKLNFELKLKVSEDLTYPRVPI
jgi:hypothetical protein